MLNILIADDHAIIRKGLIQIINDSSEKISIEEAATAGEVLDKIRRKKFDLIILDISFPDKSGLDILKDIKVQQHHLPVLILSIYPEEQYALRTLKAGASGYLTKDSAPEELMAAIKKITQGKKYISQSFAENLLDDLDKKDNNILHNNLSDREYQVLCLIASGKSVSDIANRLSLSDKTVSTYRSRILEKMKMKNNAELTYYAIKNELVE